MGIDARLEDENGGQLGEVLDERNLLSRVIHTADLNSTVCLRFLDPWGDATFNWIQMPVLIEELRAIGERVDPTTREHLEAIAVLAARYSESPHLYVKFYGD